MARPRRSPGGPGKGEARRQDETRLTGSLGRLARGEPVAFLSFADAGDPAAVEAVLAALDRQAGSDGAEIRCDACDPWIDAAVSALQGRPLLALAEALDDHDALVRIASQHDLSAPPAYAGTH